MKKDKSDISIYTGINKYQEMAGTFSSFAFRALIMPNLS